MQRKNKTERKNEGTPRIQRNRKAWLPCAVTALAFAAIFTFYVQARTLQRQFDETLYSNVIRLHIVANSNSDEDQALKYALRDKTLSYIASLTEHAENADEASERLTRALPDIRSELCRAARELGFYGKTEVTFSDERYPVRHYGTFTFPAGEYRSLKITLGRAAGKNWWCVLYPAVCTAASGEVKQRLSDVGLSDETLSALCDNQSSVQFSFYFLELLQNLKNK